MKTHYDFAHATKNPYAARLTRRYTIQLDEQAAAQLEALAAKAGMPVETLMRLYLVERAALPKRRRAARPARAPRRAA